MLNEFIPLTSALPNLDRNRRGREKAVFLVSPNSSAKVMGLTLEIAGRNI
jgi:hypothetical protein